MWIGAPPWARVCSHRIWGFRTPFNGFERQFGYPLETNEGQLGARRERMGRERESNGVTDGNTMVTPWSLAATLAKGQLLI